MRENKNGPETREMLSVTTNSLFSFFPSLFPKGARDSAPFEAMTSRKKASSLAGAAKSPASRYDSFERYCVACIAAIVLPV